MKKLIYFLLLLSAFQTKAQVISQFTWSSTPLTTAAQGPNAISVSASATNANVGGSIGWALNPGLPTANVDLVVPGSPYFDVNNIDVSLYFRREESVASFFKRGANFDFGSNGGFLTVKFTTTRGSTPGDTTINSGNIVAIANDHAFHNYRFRYDNNTGVATVLVDGTIVYTYNGVSGRPLSWTGAGNVIIGENMDATSTNIPVLANMTVKLFNLSLLPMNVTSFTATQKSNNSQLNWKVADETNVSTYVVEKSSDKIHFTKASDVLPSNKKEYSYLDAEPLSQINYYRLRIIDKQGISTFSDIKQIRFENTTTKISCYPNPAVNYITVKVPSGNEYDYSLTNLQGVSVKTGATLTETTRIALSVSPGTYILRLHNRATNNVESQVIVKGN